MGSGSCSGTAPGLAGDQGTRWGHPQPSAQRLPCQGDNSTWDEPSTEPGRIGPPQCHPTSYRPQGSRRAHPPPPAPSARVPAPSPLPRCGTGGTEGSGKLKPAPCCWDEGTQGCKGWLGVLPAGPCPPRGVPVTVTVLVLAVSRQPRGAAAPRCLLPWPCPRSLPRPRLFLLSPLLFFSLFFPPKHLPEERTGRRKHNFPL